MELEKFKQMCTDHYEFMEHIQSLTKKYSQINSIKNPLDNWEYYESYTEDGEVIFHINEDGISIHYSDQEEVSCGYGEFNQEKLLIPAAFFDESTHNKAIIESKELHEKIVRINEFIKEINYKISNYSYKLKSVQKDIWNYEDLKSKYPTMTDSGINFQDKKKNIEDEIKSLQETRVSHEDKIKKLKELLRISLK